MNFKVLAAAVLAAVAPVANAGPIAYGICQTGMSPHNFIFLASRLIVSIGCNSVVVACYAGAGLTFGTIVAAPLAPAAALACNVALGTCSAACATVALFAPTP
ncbi:hypothetical protein PHLCEN_2v10294 [Hermanssonia centrifuga]|uniref:Uncharacterized protein n=1 Tax=Hermanssonia centrifuga TaxID=98765 RepID=A0A2R6NN95_9APHY|nr:hypothetical protein PHLCEN_2v10294 [Hermanssonia centrifuga]